MERLAPYSFRVGKEIVRVLAVRAGRTVSGPGTLALGSLSTAELKAALQEITSGEMLSSFCLTLVLSLALQALIRESVNLFDKAKLRDKLVENFQQQQIAAFPNLGDLLYYDIKGAYTVFPPDYQPTDPGELERLMGSHEVYRAFLLATIE